MMKQKKIFAWVPLVIILAAINVTTVSGQRAGKITKGSVTKHLLISNGPQGPVKGGESAVTDMILMNDNWVYGSTKATWGAQICHIFRTDGDKVEHILNVASLLEGQTSITDLCPGKGNILFGCTSTYDEILDDQEKNYEGGHLFSFDIATGKKEDFGIIAPGQGINCIAIDTIRGKIYGVTYPAGHLFLFDPGTKSVKDFGEIMTPWRVMDLGRVTWRGVPKVLMIDDAGTVYFSTYYHKEINMTKQELMKGGSSTYTAYTGGLIYRLAYGDNEPVFTGVSIPTQQGMDSDPLYENGIASAIRARDGGFWCGTINDGFLFKFQPSTSVVINKGKAFQYWNLKSLTYGKDGKLYMLGGRDEDNSWIICHDPATGSIDCLGWPDNTAQCSVLCTDAKGRILIAENLRHSFIWVYEP
jgi:hypothetical protein